jgi:hypothetical protein
MSKSLGSEDRQMEAFLEEVQKLWPLAKGSLAEVRKPCIRPGCPACASGKKHPAFIFSFKHKGRRRCMHVPRALVAQMRQAIRNGRLMEEQMSHSGYELIQRFREDRVRTKGSE